MFRFTKLANGLTVLTAPDAGARSMSVAIFIGVGSRFEREPESGISHFLEHLAFRGTEKYPDKLELAKIVEGFGGRWNGGTSREWTVYWIKARPEHLRQSLDILGEMVFHPLLREDDIEVERGVIVEEINMYEDDPQTYVHELIDEVTWPDQPLGRFEGGTRESVSQLKRDDFVRYIKAHYVSGNVIIAASGAIDGDQFLNDVQGSFAAHPQVAASVCEAARELQQRPQVKFVERGTEQSHFCLNFRGYSANHPRRYVMDLAGLILGGGFSSRLFQEIRERRGLAYAISASAFHHLDTGGVQIYAGVSNDRVGEAIEAVLGEVKKMVTGVNEDELRIAKEVATGGLALALEDHATYLNWLVEQQLAGGPVLAYEEWCGRINEVTCQDIAEVVGDLLVGERLSFALVGPKVGEGTKSLVTGY